MGPGPTKGWSTLQTVADIERTMAEGFGPDWKAVEIELVALQLRHIFDGSGERALAFFKDACERGWLPYRITAEGRVARSLLRRER